MKGYQTLGLSIPPRQPRKSMPVQSRKYFGKIVFMILLLLSVGVGALGGLVFVDSLHLPQVRELENYRPDVMTELYADDGSLIGHFALERRVIVNYNQIPAILRNAVISVEDRNFESHWGVDILAIVRAGTIDLLHWRKVEGASTLTQQLARQLFLTTEKSWHRKFKEMLLAIQIERHFTKAQIFTMYANLIPLGSGNYGFEAASEFFFGKPIGQLTLPEAALLAGLPRSPTYYSPILYPKHALVRRNIVLRAMLENHKISEAQYREAVAAPLGLHVHAGKDNLAPYFVEQVREFLEKKYGARAVETQGLRVYTTLNPQMQEWARHALRKGLREYDKRHGFRGPEENILKAPDLLPDGQFATLKTYTNPDWTNSLSVGEMVHGLAVKVTPSYATVRFGEDTARVTPPDFSWTGRSDPRQIFSPGDVDLFRVHEVQGKTLSVTLDQNPAVQGAIVVLNNSTGAVEAMVGGYDFSKSKFNRAVQAVRQVGSSFKVYVYAQALLDGMTPFDTIQDAPVSYQTPSGIWTPHDYDYKFEGAITLLRAFAESRNIPAVKLLATVGISNVIQLCRKFGITTPLVPDLPLALGASGMTLLEHASAFSTFPNDGVHIAPELVRRVTDFHGMVIDDFTPQVTDVLPAGVARLEVSMLRQVIMSGTAVRARSLAAKYPIAGKTGTTNNWTDAWFMGFSPSITCGVWVGFDDEHSLGRGEEGSHVALPIWIDFMSHALASTPVQHFPDSPLLTNPSQVQEILASGGPESLPGNLPAGPPSSAAAAVITGAPAGSNATLASPANPPFDGVTPISTSQSLPAASTQVPQKSRPPAATRHARAAAKRASKPSTPH